MTFEVPQEINPDLVFAGSGRVFKYPREHMTMQDLCEVIAKANVLEKADGTPLTAREVFDYSPTGELSDIFFWYPVAVGILADRGDEAMKKDHAIIKEQNPWMFKKA